MEISLAHENVPLFVYGTLRFSRVLRALLGRVPAEEPVSVPGWRAAALARRPYPGLVPAPGHVAPGLLLSGLTPRECAVLDDFEGAEYARRAVGLGDGRRARAYVWRDAGGSDVLEEDWDAQTYAERVLAAYGPAPRDA